MDLSTDASTVVGHLDRQLTYPTNKIMKWDAIYASLTLANSARTANPRLWLNVLNAHEHPASSSDVVARFPAPLAQALNTTRYYVFTSMPQPGWDTDVAVVQATDHIYVPIPDMLQSTALIFELSLEFDTGIAADDMTVKGIYRIADKSGGPA
jgi:hypothetical protein